MERLVSCPRTKLAVISAQNGLSANHALNMGFRQLVFGSAQVYIPHTQNSQTGSSLPVDLYLRVGDFLPKLSGCA